MTYYEDETVTLYHGDCIEVMQGMAEASVDAIVTDPPYGLEFMGREWDAPWKDSRAKFRDSSEVDYDSAHRMSQARGTFPDAYVAGPSFQSWCTEWATEAMRVLKPGGHMLAFGGTRTWHRLACAIEDSGFEIRDSIAWMYGSGFPKSLDVSKAIDKLDATDERRQRAVEFQSWLREHMTPQRINELTGTDMGHHLTTHPTQPFVATSVMFDLLRPHLTTVPERIEELVRLRTVESENFKRREVTGLKTLPDSSRVRLGFVGEQFNGENAGAMREVAVTNPHTPAAQQWQGWGTALKPAFEPVVVARKPLIGTVAANVLAHGTGAINVDGCRVGTDGHLKWQQPRDMGYHGGSDAGSVAATESPLGRWPANVILDESQAENLGDESRFFYTAKANTHERPSIDGSAHPTVKPLDLMRYLVRLVTPPGGTVLEPFAGSGTTAEACIVEGFKCIAIEREADYLPLIVQRVSKPIQVTLL